MRGAELSRTRVRAHDQGMAGELPATCACPAPKRLDLRDAWRSPELFTRFSRDHLTRLLRVAVARVAKLEGWTKSKRQ